MNVEQTKFTLKYLDPARSILIEGIHGIGKSQVVAQTAAELSVETGIPHVFIDIRLSQREEGDIIGMPRGCETFTSQIPCYVKGELTTQEVVLQNVMIHDLPVWFPRDPDTHGILFFDELHYASKGVIQGCMEAFLDHRINMHPIPKNVRVVAAGNQIQDTYGGTTLNPAVYDRPLKIEFKPTTVEWTNFVTPFIHRSVLLFINKFPAKLDPPESIEPGVICPSRRSWVTLSEDIKYLTGKGHDPLKDHDYLLLLTKGRVGSSTAIDYVDFVKREFKMYSPDDILNKWSEKMEEEFKAFLPAEVSFYSNELVAHIAKAGKNLTKKQKDNLERYLKAIPKETATSFWVHFAKTAKDIALDWYNTPKVKEYIYGILDKSVSIKGI